MSFKVEFWEESIFGGIGVKRSGWTEEQLGVRKEIEMCWPNHRTDCNFF